MSGLPESGSRSGVRLSRRTWRVIAGWRIAVMACACTAGASVAPLAGPGRALADTGHGFLSSLAEAPPGTGLVKPAPVADDRLTGEVLVGDPGSGYVDVYDSAGMYETRFGEGLVDPAGVAVDESNGDVYVADPFLEAVLVYAPGAGGGYRLLSRWSGRSLEKEFGAGTEFGEVTGVAVDNSTGPAAGEVYVLEGETLGREGGAVDVFRPAPNPAEGEGGEGEFLRRLKGPTLEAPGAIAVSATTGTVLVGDGVKGAVYAYSPDGVYEKERKLTGEGSPYGPFKAREETGNVAGVAVGEADEVYVAEAERHAVSQYSYNNSGHEWEWEGWITTTPSGDLAEPRGVALTGSGEVYVADAGRGEVDRFGPGVTVPSVRTEKAAKSGLTRESAVLAGTVNGEEKPASYRFQYGEAEALGSETATKPVSGTGTQAVTATVEELQAGHTYYYRIVGENEDGSNYGVIERFETLPAVAGLETGSATNVEPEAATLTGSLKREGFVTQYHFQYGTSDTYGKQAPEPPGTVPAGSAEKEEKEAKTLETGVSGLSANTLYHYRFVAENEYGATYGHDRTFMTSGPPGICNEPATAIGQHAATLHACVNPDRLATTYHFEYGETTAYGAEVPLGGQSIGSGSTPVAVSAALTSLKVGTTYHYRVVATNQAGASEGPDQTFTTVAPAPVEATYATQITATEASLHARINPLGNDTHYGFQYGTGSCRAEPNACADIPSPPEDIGAGSEGVAREARITGLQPDTTYHFRVLDSNTLGQTEGPERTFTTQSERSFVLPDHRAWEMVTPPDKGGAAVEALTHEGGLILAAEDGSALTYVVDSALGEQVEGNRSPEMEQVLATRTPSGWSNQDIATPTNRPTGDTVGLAPEYQFFSPKLSTALVEPPDVAGVSEPPLAPGVGTQATIYLRDDATGSYLPLVSEMNTAPGTHFGGALSFVSASPDLSHVVINSSAALTGAGSAPGLYEWAGGRLQLASVRPNGKPAKGLVELGFHDRVLTNTVSRDGSRVIWSNREPTSPGHLYLRDTVSEQTIQLDAAQGGVAEPANGWAQFQWASSDGSRVFFTDKQRLTADSTADPGEPGGADLYECVITEEDSRVACHLQDLTVDHNEGEHAAVQYLILGANEDGASVYLIAHGALEEGENGNQEAAPGANNLYALHYDGTRWSTTFIATLSGEDSVEWEGGLIANRANLTARVSPNGRYLAFMSSAPLTGYDNVDANPAAAGARDEEVFLYDSLTASLRCVSCNPSGARPEGVLDTKRTGEGLGLLVDRALTWAQEGHEHWLAGSIPGWTAQSVEGALFQSRYLDDEGRLLFNSPDDLVPAAENHREDVYEYEPSGVGGCQSPSGGCVSLISGGSSARESAFIEATPGGSDVFFLTEAQLLPQQDTDTAFDIYDARECSALSPCLTPPATEQAPCAETQTCRPAPPPQPISGVSAATVPITASGNFPTQAPPAKHGIEAKKASRLLTRAQKLKRALRVCRKRHAHSRRKRRACERAARKRYHSRHAANRSRTRRRRSRTGRRSKQSSLGGLAR
jgi:hypothetical protein